MDPLARDEVGGRGGLTAPDGSEHSGYLIEVRNGQYAVWATLEDPTPADISTLDNCSSDFFDNYSSINYCVSSGL